MVQRGKARCEKATEVVQRCRRMKVSSKETLWIWGAVVDVQSVYIVTSETQYLSATYVFETAATWFSVLACDSPDSDNRQTGAPDENQRERQDKADFRGDIFVCARVETLGTITRMKEESLIALNEAELIAQPLDLLWSNDGRQRGELREDGC